MGLPTVRIDYPAWIDEIVDWTVPYHDGHQRMRLAIALARENVLREGGGPFGAAIFGRDSGLVSAVGVNMVSRLGNSVLHAEITAIMMAHTISGSRVLGGEASYELVTSCEPCAMCLGATLWSGVSRVVCGAMRDDAMRIGFDEGPVFEESYAYLRGRGIEVERGVLRDEARDVLELYVRRGGVIY